MPTKNSFILLKPDALDDQKIMNDIFNQIEYENLKVFSQQNVEINEVSVNIIWPYCKTDTVCRKLMLRYLGERQLILLNVTSQDAKDALDKTTRIKRYIRKKYSKSPFKSCVHTPSNSMEYTKDVEALTQDGNYTEFENPTVVKNFLRFEKLKESDFIACALVIEKIMNSISFEFVQDCVLDASEPYKIVLIDDDVHDAKFTAGVILEIFPEYSIEKAYYIAFGVNYLESFPVFISDKFDKFDEIKTKFDFYKMKVELINV